MDAPTPSQVLPDLKYHYKHTPHTFVDHFEVYLQELVCPICQEIVEEPLQTSCGHIFCTECHRRSRRTHESGLIRKGIASFVPCPVCRQQHTTMKDNFNDRRAKSLKVRCRNCGDGCKWVGSLADEEEHRENDSGCEFESIRCPHEECYDSVIRRDMDQHANRECPHRPYRCEYCNRDGTYMSITGPHYETCNKYPVECPNGCDTTQIPRDEVDRHKQEDCPLQFVPCQYKVIGCTEQVQRQDLQRHLEKEKDSHLQLAMDAVVDLTTKVNKMAAKVEELTAEDDEEDAGEYEESTKKLVPPLLDECNDIGYSAKKSAKDEELTAEDDEEDAGEYEESTEKLVPPPLDECGDIGYSVEKAAKDDELTAVADDVDAGGYEGSRGRGYEESRGAVASPLFADWRKIVHSVQKTSGGTKVNKSPPTAKESYCKYSSKQQPQRVYCKKY